nr:MAG TPA: hypothetical protein [Bacteriophage sp.]
MCLYTIKDIIFWVLPRIYQPGFLAKLNNNFFFLIFH